MPPPSKPTRPSHHGSGRDSGDHGATPSNTLWLGNLSGDFTDDVLADLFKRFEPLDVTSCGPRGYGFVFFKDTEDAFAAKDALQGAELKGSSIRIEFARPVCPHLLSKSLLGSFEFVCKYFYVLIDDRFCIFDHAIEINFGFQLSNLNSLPFPCAYHTIAVNFTTTRLCLKYTTTTCRNRKNAAFLESCLHIRNHVFNTIAFNYQSQ